MYLKFVILCFILFYNSSAIVVSNKTSDLLNVYVTHSDWDETAPSPPTDKCSIRLMKSLEKLHRRQMQQKSSALIDLSGYALHQPLRNAPYDMYVTDIKVRTPAIGNWVRVQKCQYTPQDNRVVTKILFNDLSISGAVKLYEENIVMKHPLSPSPSDNCNMTLRFRRAGIGIDAVPTKGRVSGGNIEVRTVTKFVDPNFVSIHAYGCKLNELFKSTTRNSKLLKETEVIQPRTNKYKTVVKKYDSLENWEAKQGGNESKLEIITPSAEDDVEPETKTFYKLPTKNFNQQKLTEMLNVQNAIAQQANVFFQQHGPFSNKPNSFQGFFTKNKPIATITELDQNLKPISNKPPLNRPTEALYSNDKILSQQSNVDDLSKEMEDVFLRGVKALLTKYLEKQLETPLKEALMTNIGYTISYG